MPWKRTRLGILGAALVLVAAGASAQPPPATPPATPGQSPIPLGGAGSISGIVKNANDDAPIGRARVSVAADALPEPRVTLSEANGRYSLIDLPAGSYTITVTHTGFAPQIYASGRSINATPIVVGKGQAIPGIDFALVPGGSIAGRIFDEDGSPFAGAIVDALVTRSDNGTDTFLSVSSCQTDDRGEFRLFGLAPGQYYVSAADPAFLVVSTPRGVLHYSPTYFPGVSFAAQAKAVVITAAGDVPRIEFGLKLVPPARVTGRLTPDDGRALFSAAIIMSPVEGLGVPMVPPRDPKLLPDGTFSFGEVVPGHYEIRARGQTEATANAIAVFGTFTLQVTGADALDIQMALTQGALLDGRLVVRSSRGTKPPPFQAIRVRAPFVDGNSFGDALTGTVQPDGTFALRGMMRGAHQLVVDGLPPPWVLDTVTYRGSEITDIQFDVVHRQQFRDVRVAITDVSYELSGVVQNARNLPVANTGVLVFPRVPLFWARTNRRMRIAYTDRGGRFSMAGLPAGEYFAVASLAVDESDLGRRDRLLGWQRVATSFVLSAEDSGTTLKLPLVAPPASAATTR
jgi:Carboxypeptidase regulatory-like domain